MTGKLLLSILVCARMWAADDPLIGTGNGAPDYNLGNGAGDTPPSVVAPFGMVFWSPDTTNLAGGYRYAHTAIQGFSLTHFSGRGISCYQDVPIMPVPRISSDDLGTDETMCDACVPFGGQSSGRSRNAIRPLILEPPCQNW